MAEPINEANGLLWLDPELLDKEKRLEVTLRDFETFRYGGRTYELQGLDRRTGLWWVERIDPDFGDDDAARILEGVPLEGKPPGLGKPKKKAAE